MLLPGAVSESTMYWKLEKHTCARVTLHSNIVPLAARIATMSATDLNITLHAIQLALDIVQTNQPLDAIRDILFGGITIRALALRRASL